ncbi:MAG: hypothetical protein ABUS57_04805 [Pseudomonadota bacterium]
MRYDITLFSVAILMLLCGEAFGIYMGVIHDFVLAPAHAHWNLVGWVTLTLYGLLHRSYPALAQSKLAPIQMWLAILGAIAFPIGIGYSIITENPILAIIASFVVLTGTLLFAVMFFTKATAKA